MSNMYREHILELYKEPSNKGRLVNETHSCEKRNSACGDRIRISFDYKGKVKDVRFEGEGCAISQAAASLLTDYLEGKNKKEVQGIDGDKMLELLGVEVAPMRLKCAMLCLEAAKNALKEENVKD